MSDILAGERAAPQALRDEIVRPLHGLSLRESVALARSIDSRIAHLQGAGLLQIETRTDFVLLALRNRDARGNDYHPLMPLYDTEYGPIHAHEAFWISCADGQGRPLASVAVRLRDIQSDLLQSWTDGSLLSDRPDLGIRGSFSGPLSKIGTQPELALIRGEVAIPGAMWVHPDLRGLRISEHLFALAILLAYRRWKPVHIVGLVELERENRLGMLSYNLPRSHKFFTFEVPGHALKAQGVEICLMTMSQQETRELFLDVG